MTKTKKKIVILGAGFGGLETAAGLVEVMKYGSGYEITLVDKNDSFFVGFSKVDVLFGRRTEEQVRSPYANLRVNAARFVQGEITDIDTDRRLVATSAGNFGYDYLVVALGADLDPDATPGFRDSGGLEFYSMEGTLRLKPVIEAFESGTLVLGILGAPYKCPPAPYEVACQLHELFLKKGIRGRVEMKMVIPTARPMANPALAEVLERLLVERGIELIRGTAIDAIDGVTKQVVIGERRLDYDCFIGVPVHVPPAVVRASKLGKGFVPVSAVNLETSLRGVYAIGDVTKIPVGDAAVPKAGAFAEDAARTVVSDILMREGLATSLVKFHAKGACYFDLGNRLVGKVDADFFGGDKPRQVVEGPSPELHADRVAFETSRRERWFE